MCIRDRGDGFSALLSSKDLCLIDHLGALRNAGVDAIKIEGRMKSVYYTAVTARAYRAALDMLEGPALSAQDHVRATAFRDELFNVSRREFSTGFLFGKEEIEKPARDSYIRNYLFVGVVGNETRQGVFRIDLKNRLMAGEAIEYTGFDVASISDQAFTLLDNGGQPVPALNHNTPGFLATSQKIKPGYLIRKRIPPPEKTARTDPSGGRIPRDE